MLRPKPLKRREVLHAAAALGLCAAWSAPRGAAAASPLVEHSGLVTGQLKPLKYEEIPGLLSRQQVAPHYQAHYGGALRRLVNLERQIEELLAGDQPLGGDAYTLMQKDKVNRMNSVLLHELYFDGLAPTPPEPKAELRAAITARFGSLDRWVEDFKACCTAAAGWGILARDAVNGKLYNVASDLHEVGVIWLGQPIIVCDVYEHAFYVDYQNRKQEYVDKFVAFLDWDELNRRWMALSG
jgi:Fe-Mn family superoxide dismutase